MKKHLTDQQIRKLVKYIPLVELKQLKKDWGEIPDGYWKSVNGWNDFLEFYLATYPIDHYTLAVILHEIQVQFHRYERKYLSYKDSIPLTHSGAKGLLNTLELFDDNFLNIELIIIKTKSFTQYTKDTIPKNINDLRIKDIRPVNYRITGKEVIIEIFKLIRNNKHKFEILSESEEKLTGETFEFIKKNKPKVYFRKLSSDILYNYLRDHFPKVTSDNKIFNIGGFLQYHLDLMPESKKDLSKEKILMNFLISNFKKALFSTL